MAQPKKKGAKKKEKRIVPSGTAYVLASFNNTVVTITDLEGNVVCWSSAGSLGFKGFRPQGWKSARYETRRRFRTTDAGRRRDDAFKDFSRRLHWLDT